MFSAKRPKNDAPSGLITGWRLKVKKASITTALEDVDDAEIDGAAGEFDVDDTPYAIAAARASKQIGIQMKTPGNNVSIITYSLN